MNDDLNLLLSLVTNNTLVKVAIHIEHGLNNFTSYEYFGEEDVIEKYNELLPEHLKPCLIVAVERLQDIIYNVLPEITPVVTIPKDIDL